MKQKWWKKAAVNETKWNVKKKIKKEWDDEMNGYINLKLIYGKTIGRQKHEWQ